MKNNKILLFAGTTEGRKLAEMLDQEGIAVTLYVATEYGEYLMPKKSHIEVQQERLEEHQIKQLLLTQSYQVVIDATHPFAEIVTKNIKTACKETNTRYLRVIRPTEKEQGVTRVKNIKEAAKFLENTTGNILLTTGSKDLEIFTAVPKAKERIYVRLLPMPSNIQKCINLGFGYHHLIAMQGPFSYELNKALLEQIQATYMVTKDSGAVGGVKEKIQAAKDLGIKVILIERPKEETGYNLEEIMSTIKNLLK